jgi:5,10-methylene-tetrahydrofolate dehydrogenase/methenyl tetrahydrofolate cyclohydrolase
MESPEASRANVITTKGIFTGLPTFPSSLSGFSAVVVGASGISGQHMLHVLSQSPKRWSKIYALSRSLPYIPENTDGRVIHVPVDLLKGPEEIAATLREAQVKA